ncbi:C-type lectin domain family 2 member B-like [Tachyglossus aculeatus]|uniref:C-type lectin domain family 2 member B-like n=1 Tax=Tachyglossus aculeatus TaxID=9261 RepID=UPI0018F6F233|nr:C-type lectin domain family 2 member B-like [Tachyglossus aculeatus]
MPGWRGDGFLDVRRTTKTRTQGGRQLLRVTAQPQQASNVWPVYRASDVSAGLASPAGGPGSRRDPCAPGPGPGLAGVAGRLQPSVVSVEPPGGSRAPPPSPGFPPVTGGTITYKQLFIPSIVVLAALLGLSIPLAKRTCPECRETCRSDWLQLRNKCYFYDTEEKNWNKSQEFCKKQNANLVVIENHQELALVQKFQGSWIGLHRINAKLFWVNGALFNETLFQVSDPGDCAYISADKIATNGCSTNKSSVCSMHLNVT